jgi:hypothetical protein
MFSADILGESVGGDASQGGCRMSITTHSLAPISKLAKRLALQPNVFKGVSQISRISRLPYPKTKIIRETTGTILHEWHLQDNENSLSITVCLGLLRRPFERLNVPILPIFLQAFLLVGMSTPANPANPANHHMNQIVEELDGLLTVLSGGGVWACLRLSPMSVFLFQGGFAVSGAPRAQDAVIYAKRAVTAACP